MSSGLTKRPTMRQLRRWHRKLNAAHRHAVAVSAEANDALGEGEDDAVIISDPIIELHAALGCIEGLIDERTQEPTNTTEETK